MHKCMCGLEFHEIRHFERHQRQFRYNEPDKHKKIRSISHSEASRKGAQTRRERLNRNATSDR